MQPQGTLQLVVEFGGQCRLAVWIVKAQGPVPGLQVHLGHYGDQQQQGVVGWQSIIPHKQLLEVCPGHSMH